MDITKEKFEIPCPTIVELRNVFALSKQHINVITRELHKVLPTHWPAPPLEEARFYELLLNSLQIPQLRLLLDQTLQSLADSKSKSLRWKKVLIPEFRLLSNGLDLVRKLDPDAYRDLAQFHDAAIGKDILSEPLVWLEEHGFPEYQRILTWLMDTKGFAVMNQTESGVQSKVATPLVPTEDITNQWDICVETIKAILSGAATQRFSKELVEKLQSKLDHLHALAKDHESSLNKRATELKEKLILLLNRIDSNLKDGDEALRQRLRATCAEIAEEFITFPDWLSESLVVQVDGLANQLIGDHQRRKQLQDLIADSNQKEDYKSLEGYASEAKRVTESLKRSKQNLLEIFSELHGDGSNELIVSPNHSPISEHGDGDAIPDVEPPPPPPDPIVEKDKPLPPNNEPTAGSDLQPETQEYSAKTDVESLAARASCEFAPAIHAANALIWALIREGCSALAYHLARFLEAKQAFELTPLNSQCIIALFLARHIQSHTDEVLEPLRDAMTSFLPIRFFDRQLRHQRTISLLAYAAALRPALFAPDLTGARAVLDHENLPLDFSSLHELREAVLQASRLSLPLSVSAIKGQAGPETWERQLADLQQRCDKWWQEYRRKNIKYAPTTHVWQRWLEEEGAIGALLKAVVDNQVDMISQAESDIAQWQDRKIVNKRLDEMDLEFRGRNAKLRPIDGSPRMEIVRLAAEAMSFVQEWLSLVGTKPSESEKGHHPQLRDWVQRTRSLIEKAKEELTQTENSAPKLQEYAAIKAVLGAIQDLDELLDPDRPVVRVLPWWQHLGAELSLCPDMPLDAKWQPAIDYADDRLLHAIKHVAIHPNDWKVVFDSYEKNCDHAATERIIQIVRWRGESEERLEELETQRGKSLDRCREHLHQRTNKISEAVSHAVDYGYLDEEERSKMVDVLESCKTYTQDAIGDALAKLGKIEITLKQNKQRRIQEEWERLGANPVVTGNDSLRSRIEALLANGDIATAAEYVTHAENGRQPPSDDQKDLIGDIFFPEFLQAVSTQLDGQKGGDILRTLVDGLPAGPVNVPAGELEHAKQLLRDWLLLIRNRQEPTRNIVPTVQKLFSGLGFSVIRVEEERFDQSVQSTFHLFTQPLQDRSTCIVPQYGSLAKGRYRIVCVWERMPVDELRRKHLRQRERDAPVILLYLNRMSAQQRRDLAFQCRQNRQTLLVIDEWLLYFLLMQERGARLAAFFQCAFPFTIVNPYTPTSSDVPDELFFGRRRAIEQIVDLHGTNLVFGGRQLGKTAMLREVKRRYHDLERGFCVIWIDLKAARIGFGRPLDEIWAVIGGELANERLIAKQVSRTETVQNQIQQWLGKDEHRRLLVLLDEADQFFSQDSEENHYSTLMGLKGLMERTNLRFKVVFAGLHNVQRMSRDVNSPVKHLAKPVCVGPLLEDGEAREAFRLVAMPLRTLGYRLEDDAVNRILSYTNYYPNLIQYFCHSLVEYLNDHDQVQFEQKSSPPYRVTHDQVEQAYQRRELRQFIRDRFQITLYLDPRYRVIALRIALETLERRKRDVETTSGFSVDWIREQSLGLWARGFKDKTHEAFRTLLDEMIGLGILRSAENGYALRSPNIVNILGAHDAIEQDLLDSTEKDPPPVYTAATYRRPLRGDHWQRSPLVAEQEYEILQPETGLNLLFGTPLAGLERVVSAIEAAVTEVAGAEVKVLSALNDHNEFEKQLRFLFDHKKSDANLVILVDAQVPWSETWVGDALCLLGRSRSKKTTVRVVFIGDPSLAWLWSGLSENERTSLGQPKIITLKPWLEETLRQWQSDSNIGPINLDYLQIIKESTGLWDELINRLSMQIKEDPTNWRRIMESFLSTLDQDRGALKQQLTLVPSAEPMLKAMAEIDEALSPEDLADLTGEPSIETAQRVIYWADLLALVIPEGRERWRLDPFVARLLRD